MGNLGELYDWSASQLGEQITIVHSHLFQPSEHVGSPLGIAPTERLGQKIGGLSTIAFQKLAARYRYQGDYSEEEENLQWNEFQLRNYDPQIGRWTGADPFNQFASPYVGMGNDPVNHTDPDGGNLADVIGTSVGATAVGLTAYYIAKAQKGV